MTQTKGSTKIRLAILATIFTGIVFVTLFMYIGVSQVRENYKDSKTLAKEVSYKASLETQNRIADALMSARTLAQKGIILRRMGASRFEIVDMLFSEMKDNPFFQAAWTMWEPNAYDGNDTKYKGLPYFDSAGHLSTTVFRYNDTILIENTKPEDYLEFFYTKPKGCKCELILEPYYYKYLGYPYLFFETSIITPILENDQFLGVFAIDIDLDKVQTSIKRDKLYETGYLSLISNSGIIVSHPDTAWVKKNLFGIINDPENTTYKHIKTGREYELETVSEFTGEKVFRFFYPMQIGQSRNPWCIMAEIPIHTASFRSKQMQYTSFGILILGISLLMYLIYNIVNLKKDEHYLTESLKHSRESEHSYRTIFNSSSEAIFVHDAISGNIIDLNEVALNLFGFENREQAYYLEDKDLLVTGFSNNNISSKEAFELAKNQILPPFEWHSKKKNGETFWAEVSLRSIIINGRPCILAVGRDVTEKKRVAAELENHRNRLEMLVKERTEELASANEELMSNNELLHIQRNELEEALAEVKSTQQLLVQSEKMASLGILAAGVAHEINNPLNFIEAGITGIESLLKTHNVELKDLNILLNSIHTGVARVSAIVESLNKYTRHDESSTSQCDIHLIIENCLLMLERQTANRITINKNFTSNPYELTGKEGKLHQALLNLITNAIQSIKGEGSILISTAIEKKHLIVRISDTGSGINEKNLNRLTDPFFTTKDPGQGTGLGLAITYSIVQEHRGILEFESLVGVGTTVSLRLPIKRTPS